MGKKQMTLFQSGQGVATRPRPTDEELRGLIARIHPDFKPVWDGLPEEHQLALAAYFLPRKSTKEKIGPTRPKVLDWYCPFAAQSVFPSGHRYCLNVYSGCAHDCEYCYAMSYAPPKASCKRGFERMLERDLADLETFDVPPAPVHLSNSTDPFQPLEQIRGHARLALEGILAHRHRFSVAAAISKIDPDQIDRVLPVLVAGLDSGNSLWRGMAAEAIGELGEAAAAAMPNLEALLQGDCAALRCDVALAMLKITGDPARAIATGMLSADDWLDRYIGVEHLGLLGPLAASATLGS